MLCLQQSGTRAVANTCSAFFAACCDLRVHIYCKPSQPSPTHAVASVLHLSQTSVSGMIGVLESGVELQGTWHAYDGKVIPW